MHEMLPSARVIAVLINPTNVNAETLKKDLEEAAHTLGLRLRILHTSTERQMESAFAKLIQPRPAALVIGPDAFFNDHGKQLAALTLRYGVPAIYQYRDFVTAGGLMSYGTSITDAWRLVGTYTGRILRGERPANLPVQQITKVELLINLRTAKTLGLTFPITLLGRADEVIE
jgi:putative ABC transport system substrate-binding protein